MRRQTRQPIFVAAPTRPGPIGLLREALVEVTQRRRLIRYLVQADIRKKGADTLLGNLWWVLDPLLQMAVYVVLVSVVFDRDVPDYPLFIFAAILPWKWFQSTVQDAITSVTGADRLIRQIQFPKLVLPVASAGAGVVNFVFGLIPLAALMLLLYRDRLSVALVLIPLIAVVQFFFNARDRRRARRAQRVLPRRRQPVAARAAALVLPVARAVRDRGLRRGRGRDPGRRASCSWPTRSRSCSPRTAT